MPKIKKINSIEPKQQEELDTINKKRPSEVSRLRETGKVANNTEIPDMVADSEELSAEIKTGENMYPPVSSGGCAADQKVKQIKENSKEWDRMKPFRLDEVNDNPPYRGQGLLPTDQTIGNKVVGK